VRHVPFDVIIIIIQDIFYTQCLIFLQKLLQLEAQRSKVLAEFDDALSLAGLPQLIDGPLLLENAQTGERLTVWVATVCCEHFISKVSKNATFRID
jgi:hypothetical protein